ncbi:OmpA family protein [Candidatus Kapabacteria bacterium]|nr:OmpA family protein [Candidatus Kapabacteria bacterium]
MKIILSLFILSSLHLLSQQESTIYVDSAYSPRQSFGLFLGGGLNFHVADFETLPTITGCCDGYSTGTGLGLMGGLYYAVPLGNTFELDLRLNYMDLSGKLTKTEERNNSVLSADNDQIVNATIEHEIDGTINLVAFEPSLIMKLGSQLRLRAGLSAGFIMTKDFAQTERITNPSTGVFIDENGTRSREINIASGEIPEAPSLNLGFLFGASYDLPLNKNRTLFLVPEARYTIGLSSFHSEQTWLPSQFAGGIGIRYAPRKKAPPKKAPPPPPPPPPVPLPPPPPLEPSLDARIAAVSVDENNIEYPVSLLKVEEFYENNTHPLLNYVFFDENSSTLPPRYTKMGSSDVENFTWNQFFSSKTLDVYYSVLNIIGKRMKFYPQAELTLIGCNSNQGKEKGNIALSKARAQTVKDYLVNVWGISGDRLIVKSRNLPGLPSNSTTEDGVQENRRVEIIPNYDRLFEPIISQNSFKETNPPNFRFRPEIKTKIGVSKWEIQVQQAGNTLKRFTGNGNVPKQVDWAMGSDDEQENLPDLNQSLEYKLIVTDNDGKIWESDIQILPVKVITVESKIVAGESDMEIDNLSMIGFGFNKDELNETNKNIADKAKLRLRDNSDIEITGHSDRMGNADRNLTLSRMRAESAAVRMEIQKSEANGLGESVLLYDNNLPEGRFYSRTVKIKIETPIEAYEELE